MAAPPKPRIRTLEPYRPRGRTLGEFLCLPSTNPPVVDIDRLPWQDIKQDACLRAIVALKRAGKPIGPDPIAAFDAEPRIVMTAYRRAYYDALRQHLGRGKDAHGARWSRLVSLDHGFEEIADPTHEEAFDAILRRVSAATRLLVMIQRGHGGVSKEQLRKILLLLRRVQRLRESDTFIVPGRLRAAVSRLRTETRLPIDIRRL
jgi:hypothetical protein